MPLASHSQPKWLLLLGAVLLVNLALYVHLSTRLGRMEQSLAAVSSSNGGASKSAPTWNDSPAGVGPTRSAPPISDIGSSPQELIDRMKKRKAHSSAMSPTVLAAELENQYVSEPSIPAAEQRQSQWLSDALLRMPADAPKAEDLQTTCRGRRCLVTAYFSNDSDARSWASSYLLAGGGEVLGRARTVILPATGSDGMVALQLHFF